MMINFNPGHRASILIRGASHLHNEEGIKISEWHTNL